MAVFSPNNEAETVDIRKSGYSKGRNAPYKLPEIFEQKLLALMKILGVETGSLDIIKAIDGEFYLLEINPVGIFENVSYNCNYNLEKIIAEYLSNYVS